MKNLKFIVMLVVITLTFAACKNSNSEHYYADVDAYESYIDSISNVGMKDVSDRWDDIETNVRNKRTAAEAQLNSITRDDKLRERYEQKIYSTNERFEDFRRDVLSEREKMEATTSTQNLRNSLFRNVSIGDDRNFDWVNKDNILTTYDHFVTTVSNNKDSYTREEWDEIKMLYEALDARKNTVEKEGLTGEDNRKIAALKVKFAPMYTINRIEQKVKENSDSKE